MSVHVKYSSFFSDFEWNFNSLDRLKKKKIVYQISSKSVQWESSCFTRTDGHDDANRCYSRFWEGAKTKWIKNEMNRRMELDEKYVGERRDKWKCEESAEKCGLFFDMAVCGVLKGAEVGVAVGVDRVHSQCVAHQEGEMVRALLLTKVMDLPRWGGGNWLSEPISVSRVADRQAQCTTSEWHRNTNEDISCTPLMSVLCGEVRPCPWTCPSSVPVFLNPF
jgi:hypothetical protein